MNTALYAKPEILSLLPRGIHAVIEASAGTGKTYTLEHLVVELVLSADVPLESILVVTYTERAAGELRVRVRKKLRELIDLPPGNTIPDDRAVWRIDEAARLRLVRALNSFDLASISTIHAFCQSMLVENAFLGRRLFDEELIDGRVAFARAFIDTVRRVLARDPRYLPYLEAWLATSSLAELEMLLFECLQRRGVFRPPFDPQAITAIVNALAALPPPPPESVQQELRASKVPAATMKALTERYRTMLPHLVRFGQDQDLPRLLVGMASAEDEHHNKLASYLREKIPELFVRDQRIKQTLALLLQVTSLLTPLRSAVAETLLPPVREELARTKAKRGELDFDDMLALLWSSLSGPRGDELARSIRARFSAALVDEFQDTDDIQWRIFERIFIDPRDRARTLYLIGDPKQSIYTFRGADVHTYLRAVDRVREAGGTRVALSESYRSTVPLVEALNTLFDQKASAPFFDGAINYENPVRAARLPQPTDLQGPPVRVFAIRSEEEELTPYAARGTHARQIAAELRAIFASSEAPPNDIFVLTRTLAESVELGHVFRSARIPHAFYKQEGLFQTDEASEIRTLLLAVAAPEITARRVRAWMGQFFAVPLEAIERCLDLPATHPLLERLHAWRSLAKEKNYGRLFNSILEDSGILRREIFFQDSERELTNYVHIFELLHEEASRSHATLEELIHTLTAFIEKRRSPEGENGNVQRLESERAAVQIMTMHKAKGLEARVVFIFGALQASRGVSDVNLYHEGHERLMVVGSRGKKTLIDREKDDEDRRLLYVALTRAKERLYLPYFPNLAKLDGAYRHVNNALRRVESSPLFGFQDIVSLRTAREKRIEVDTDKLSSWRPPRRLLADIAPPEELDLLKSSRAGLSISSYSQIKASSGGYHAPDPAEDRAATIDVPIPGMKLESDLPPGASTGRFLHDALENVPLASFEHPLESWAVRKDVRSVFDDAMKKHDVPLSLLPRAQELVYAGLGGTFNFADVELPRGIASTQNVVREMEFLYSLPGQRTFIKGYIDLVFQHRGKIYLLDWKSDLLPSYASDALEVHCAHNYALQAQLYTTALVKMLAIETHTDYDRIFGGTIYVFLRGLPKEGIRFARVPWSEVDR